MPTQNDDKRRWLEVSYLVPGTPEQVWAAMATGPGMSAWFTKVHVEPFVGGTIKFVMAPGMESSGKVTAYEPLQRFAYEEYGWSDGAPPLATEVTITSRSGDQCVVRMVHSLYTSSAQWDDEIDGFEKGWAGFFDVLRLYLRDFAGQPAAIAHAHATAATSTAGGWKQLMQKLGMSGADIGDHCAVAGITPPLAGVVEKIHQEADVCVVTLRLQEPAAGIAVLGSFRAGPMTRIAASLFCYGDDAAATAARLESQWSAWMATHFPA